MSSAALDDNAFALGSVFVTHAAVALAGALHNANMPEALTTRGVIRQAKGIPMPSRARPGGCLGCRARLAADEIKLC